ncbi:MAG: hypothetical protein LLF86_06230 [Nitrospiraceae bacterium]|nr:hypothetical protein [Nitrospiraceae bacterium]
MEALIGTVIGALIASVAMIFNSHLSARRQQHLEDHLARRKQLEKDIGDLSQLYQDSLQILERIIRKYGFDENGKLEALYNIEVKLQLTATTEIYDKFKGVKSAVAAMAHTLPAIPKEFIPKFEDDADRYARLEAGQKAEKKRDAEAKKHLPEIYKKYQELSELMKQDLINRKKLES